MWQPNRAQWPIIWTIAVLLVVAWPPDKGQSLLLKAIHWAVDPADTLPPLPPALPIGLDDDGEAVTAHDEQEREYYRVRNSSRLAGCRMDMKVARDPWDTATERQLLVGLAVLAGLAVWRLNAA